MCFNTLPGHTDQLVAEEDIPCFKVVRGNNGYSSYFSVWQGFCYTRGESYRLAGPFVPLNSQMIYEGFHSYTNIQRAGLQCNCGNDEFIISCLIPKGSQYYRNDSASEFVSNHIKIL